VGFFDKAKGALTKAVDEHGDQIQKGADKLEQVVDDKTGHQHDKQVGQGKKALEGALDNLDGKKDDMR
jgi:hypothetical protein